MTETKTKKVTKREVINAMLAVETIVANPDFKAYLENELELLNKKASSKGNSKASKENAELMEIILTELEKVGEPVTITDFMNRSEVIKNYVLENGNPLSNQKITALVKMLGDKVVKVTDKKKTYISVANQD